MFEEEKNLKDSNSPLPNLPFIKGEEQRVSVSYTKTNKLVTALFMVTDIMDKHEPIRNKLRTLGVGIISDINSDPAQVEMKASEILSFLDLALAINLISNMNGNILKQEFFKLLESIKEYRQIRSVWVGDFLSDSTDEDDKKYSELITRRHTDASRTLPQSTRIGVQKGSTLMNALRGVNTKVSDKKIPVSTSTLQTFDVLKKNRRADIISVLKTSGSGLTITDIKNKSKGQTDKLSALASCGEKTLQRELVSMVKDGVLKKEGEKRWSRYSIN